MKALIASAALLAASPAFAAFDPTPWLEDLEQARAAFHEKYANLGWLEGERRVNLDALFDDGAARLKAAPDAFAARAVFERIGKKLDDGHVAFRWPSVKAAVSSAAAPASPCAAIGYDGSYAKLGAAEVLEGYAPLSGDNVFPAGVVTAGGRKVGVVRVGIFMPQGYPALCEAALTAMKHPASQPCGEACADEVVTRAYARMTADFDSRLKALKAAGAEVLLVDIGGNGGGSEWAEAAARSVSRRPLQAARLGAVRGEHWVKAWDGVLADLRGARAKASAADRKQLDAWIAEAERLRSEAATPCNGTGCERLAPGGYATGLIPNAPAGAFLGKDWSWRVFSPGQHAYHDGAWSGPVIVLVDQETWSAAEEFTAELQDNGAAVVMGARTGGAGCGHTWGGTPTTLKNSGAVLEMPDCARFRRDGSNEVSGIVPDVVVGTRYSDGPAFKAKLIAEKLPEAIDRAIALDAR